MTEPLRPLSTGELLDRTFALYRQNFKLFIAVGILGPLCMLVGQLGASASGLSKPYTLGVIRTSGAIGVAYFVALGLYIIGHAISSAATIRAVAAVYLGKSITVGEAFASIKGRVLRVLGVVLWVMVVAGAVFGLLVGLGAFAVAMLVFAGQKAMGQSGTWVGGAVGVVVMVLAVLAGIAFAVRYAVAIQACVVEELKVGAALKRSRALMKDARKRVVTVYVVCVVIIWGVSLAFVGLSAVIPAGGSVTVRAAITQTSQMIASALGAPLLTICLSLVYYDERVRKEAFDLQLLMESLEAPVPAPGTLPGAISNPTPSELG